MSMVPGLPNGAAPSTPAQQGAPSAPPPEGGAAAPAERQSAKLGVLARQEAAAVKKMREAKTYEAQVKAREEALAAREAKIAEEDRLWKEKPWDALKSKGYDYNQLTMMQLNNGQMTPEMQIQRLSQEIQTLRQERETEKTQAGEQTKAQAEREVAEATQEMQNDIGAHLKDNAEKYPLTHLYNRGDLIYSAIEAHYNKTLKETGVGDVMDLAKASEAVEAYLLKDAQKAQQILNKPNPAAAPSQAQRRFDVPKEQQWVEKPVKTLANVQPSVPSQPTHYLSESERVEKALARLRAAKQR